MTSAATQARLWYVQRLSAMVMALCVLVHLAGIVYAVRSGLSAGEILSRTHGNWALFAFYGVFVLACAVHVPIGLTAIAAEWLNWRGRGIAVAASLYSAAIAIMGLRALYGLVAS
jgi:fumarate reductase subunit C